MERGGREEHPMDDDDRVVADTQRDGASGRGLDRHSLTRCVPDDNGHPYRIPFLHHLYSIEPSPAIAATVAGSASDFR